MDFQIKEAIATLDNLRTELIFGTGVEELPGVEGELRTESRLLLWQATTDIQRAELALRMCLVIAERERRQ